MSAGKADTFESIDVEALLRARHRELEAAMAERDRRIAELEAAIKPAKELASVFIHVLTGAKLTDEAYALLPRSYDLVKLIGFPDSKP